MELTVAGLQHAGHAGDVAANVRALDEAARRARERGADLLVTPEMFLTGYNIDRDLLVRLARTDLVAQVARIATRHGLAVAAGLPEPTADGGLHNSVVLVSAEGHELARYRKTHLFGELDRGLFVAGDDLGEPVVLHGVRLALMICYDVEFPETVRRAALRGAELVVVPTAQMEPYAHVAERLVAVRAWENQVYLAYVNRVGQEGDLRYVGSSAVIGPGGEVLDHLAGDRSTGLVVATVDTDVVARARKANPYLDDLRRELY